MTGNLPRASEKKLRHNGDDSRAPHGPEKRRSSDNLPSYEEAATNNATEEELPPCVHWSEAGCSLRVRPRKCCACMDERPEVESGLYSTYVDGEGWVEKAARWQHYCPECKYYFDPDARKKLLESQREWAEKRAKSSQNDLRGRILSGLRSAHDVLQEAKNLLR
ncbi:hypothetical protein F5Y13DRAFT_161878 [Hypoxylon sp. FL1857]|nr:hypothetical protein F5Y13DRAFT_161878 [Hypoxylon sp. FL1857]